MSQSKRKHKEAEQSKWWRPQVWWVPIAVALIGLVGVIIPLLLKSNSPTPQPDEKFEYQVRVQAKATGEAIPNATVTIEIRGKAPLDQLTDSNGVARVFVDADRARQPGRLIVDATGYKKHTQNIDLAKDLLPDVVQLEPAQ